MHGVALGERDAGGSLGVEQFEERALFGVVGLGRVAGGRADAAVFFLDQVVVRKLLVAAVAPGLADFGVQIFGKCFGQAVGEGFRQDRVVIVVLAVELLASSSAPMPAVTANAPM